MDDALEKLRTLGFPSEDFAVFGSGPLIVRHLRDNFSDLDVVARGRAWEIALEKGEVTVAPLGDTVSIFHDGLIEVFNGWSPGDWDVDLLVDTADIIDGIRYVTLENVIKWKEEHLRQGTRHPDKDRRDIKLVREYLQNKFSC